MIIQPNKPVLFGVNHTPAEVKKWLALFRTSLKGKKVLYIEGTAEALSQLRKYEPKVAIPDFDSKKIFSGVSGSYRILAHIALEAGLKVVPLDRKDWNDKIKSDAINRGWLWENMEYQLRYKREKSWAETLRNSGSSTIAVMHPEHAIQIQERLKIPNSNCVFTGYIEEKFYRDPGAEALKEAKRIETARLERRKRSSQARQKRNR